MQDLRLALNDRTIAGLKLETTVLGKLRSVARLSLATKSALFSVIGIVLVSASIIIAVLMLVERKMRNQAQARQETNMRVAWDVLRRPREPVPRDGGPADDRRSCDQQRYRGGRSRADAVGGTATVFFGDTRISTNVRKADGSRAIGTKLAQGPAYDAVFKRGKSYRGETDILGERCFTGYDPIRRASGAVISVLYVGLKQ